MHPTLPYQFLYAVNILFDPRLSLKIKVPVYFFKTEVRNIYTERNGFPKSAFLFQYRLNVIFINAAVQDRNININGIGNQGKLQAGIKNKTIQFCVLFPGITVRPDIQE